MYVRNVINVKPYVKRYFVFLYHRNHLDGIAFFFLTTLFMFFNQVEYNNN